MICRVEFAAVANYSKNAMMAANTKPVIIVPATVCKGFIEEYSGQVKCAQHASRNAAGQPERASADNPYM